MGTFTIGIILFRKINIQKLKHFKNSNLFETLGTWFNINIEVKIIMYLYIIVLCLLLLRDTKHVFYTRL